ncbi:uncharacterized protein I206_106283 [Kwoniella pini CBS 10737]|uniref:BRCT domain-containing protein n=1 Tax=Kwoniella pini CBS 10737 TaxID=1296096 RepID=A0A1B9I1I9_9TREE|nr:uncharacterized protein I206_05109 [Kwoniella pini CBS 10737]OCF49416.1 hypothetical protein I206_05109 [Kwoniella pini CBS 10737]
MGPLSARRNLERKIIDGGGMISPFEADSEILIMVNPIYSPDKQVVYHHFEQARRQNRVALTEGWVHDCFSTRQRLSQSRYLVKLEDLETLEAWKRTKDRRLSDVPKFNILPSVRSVTPAPQELICTSPDQIDDDNEKASRAYGTPISPVSICIHRAVSTGEPSKASAMESLTLITKNDLAESKDLKRKFSIDDSDLDICCSDPEDGNENEMISEDEEEPIEVTLGHEKSHVASISRRDDLVFDDDFMSIFSSEGDESGSEYEEALRKREKFRSILDVSNEARIKRKIANNTHRKTRSRVSERDQPGYERLLDTLKKQVQKGGIPKGGIRAFTNRFGLEAIYRRYSRIVRKSVPGLDGYKMKDRRPQKIKRC